MGVSALISGLSFTASAATTRGGAWLSVSPADGAMPATLRFRADPTSLAPGAYQGTITITAPNAAPAQRFVAVTLNVAPAEAPRLGTETGALAFTHTLRSSLLTQSIVVLNRGGGSLDFSASQVRDG